MSNFPRIYRSIERVLPPSSGTPAVSVLINVTIFWDASNVENVTIRLFVCRCRNEFDSRLRSTTKY